MPSYAELVQGIYYELNQLRTNPTTFAERMEVELTQQFKTNNARHRTGSVPVLTREGLQAARSAIDFVKDHKPIGGLAWSEGLARAAQSHVNDTGPLGIVGHTGSNESTLGDRLALFGKWSECIAENLDYSSVDAFETVVSFLVDDGLQTRPHRNAIMNPRFKKLGVGAGPHSEYKSVFCVVLAGEFVEKDELPNVDVPNTGISQNPELDDWADGAVKMTCETRTETENGITMKRVKKF